jgi:hypothetical protein
MPTNYKIDEFGKNKKAYSDSELHEIAKRYNELPIFEQRRYWRSLNLDSKTKKALRNKIAGMHYMKYKKRYTWVIAFLLIGFGWYELNNDARLRWLIGLNAAPYCSSQQATDSLKEILANNKNPSTNQLLKIRKELTLTAIVELSRSENVRHCTATINWSKNAKILPAISAYLTNNNDDIKYDVMITDRAQHYIIKLYY